MDSSLAVSRASGHEVEVKSFSPHHLSLPGQSAPTSCLVRVHHTTDFDQRHSVRDATGRLSETPCGVPNSAAARRHR